MSYRGMGQVAEAATVVPSWVMVERQARTSAGGFGAAIAALFGRRSSPEFTAALTSLASMRGRPEIAAMAAEWAARPADQHRAGLLAIAEFARRQQSGQAVSAAAAGARGAAVGRGIPAAEIDAAATALRSVGSGVVGGAVPNLPMTAVRSFAAGMASPNDALREINSAVRAAAMSPGADALLALAALTTALAAHHSEAAARAARGPATSGLGGYYRSY